MLNVPINNSRTKIDYFISDWDKSIVILAFIPHIGYIRAFIFKDNITKLHIEEIHIDKPFRGTGQGTILIHYMFDLCKLNNINIVSLDVNADKWMIKWYKRLNFIQYETLTDNYVTLIKII